MSLLLLLLLLLQQALCACVLQSLVSGMAPRQTRALLSGLLLSCMLAYKKCTVTLYWLALCR